MWQTLIYSCQISVDLCVSVMVHGSIPSRHPGICLRSGVLVQQTAELERPCDQGVSTRRLLVCKFSMGLC
jgi:hypothetical protein